MAVRNGFPDKMLEVTVSLGRNLMNQQYDQNRSGLAKHSLSYSPENTYPYLYPDFNTQDDFLFYLSKPCYQLPPDMLQILQMATGENSVWDIQRRIGLQSDVVALIELLSILGYLFLETPSKKFAVTKQLAPKALVVSPHMDDAFISIGGYLTMCSRSEHVQVLDVFGQDPWIVDQRMGLSAPEKIAYRRDEESFNAARVDCSLKIWDFPSRAQRGYALWNAEVDPARDRQLIAVLNEQLLDEIGRRRYETVLVPLGIGDNTDHLLIHNLFLELIGANQLASLGVQRIGFYEDMPYSCSHENWRSSLPRLERLLKRTTCQFVDIVSLVSFKQQLLQTYRSQLGPHRVFDVIAYAQSKNMHTSIPEVDLTLSTTTLGHYERIWWLPQSGGSDH